MTRSATPESQNTDFADEAKSANSAITPAGEVVILRESQLDCDLQTAIDRIRADEGTSTARILVVAAEDSADCPGSGGREWPPPIAPLTAMQLSRSRETSILQGAGQRFLPLLECLERFNSESTEVLSALDEEVTDQTRARLKNRIATLRSIHDWAGAVVADLASEAGSLATGQRRVDSRELCEEMARQIEVRFPDVRVMPCRGPAAAECIGRAAEVADILYLAIGLVARRIGGVGRIHVEIEEKDGLVLHRIAGDGEPRPIEAEDWIRRFRELVEAQGGRVEPDLTGPGGTGISLVLPAQA